MTRFALLPLVAAAVAITAVDAQSLPSFQTERFPRSQPTWKTWTSPPSNLDTPAPTAPTVTPTATPLVAAATTPSAVKASSDHEIRPLPVNDTTTAVPSDASATTNTTAPSDVPITTATATATPVPTNVTDTPAPTTESLPPTPVPVATTPAPTAYQPPPIPAATDDSATFQLVPPMACDENVASTIEAIYLKNRDLFDTCAADSAYQIFPFSGTRPTPTQIRALATSKACTVLFTACVLADLPECDTTGISLKAVTETLLKVTMDVEQGRPTPDTDRFHDMHIWRRDSNLAKAAGVPNGNDSALYAEFARDLPTALATFSVELKGDLRIVHMDKSAAAKEFSFGSSSGAMRDVAGAVHANDGATDDDGSVRSADSNASAKSTAVQTLSGAVGAHHGGVVTGALALVVGLGVTLMG